MASPNPKNGHIDIPHELAEELMKINISRYQYRILWLVWRKTYGWHKDSAHISLTKFEKYTDLDRRNIARTIKELERLNIIKVERGQGRNEYSFNLDYEMWNRGASVNSDTSVGRDTTPVSIKTPKIVSVETHIKEKKETIKKKEDPVMEIFDYYCQKIKKLRIWDKKRKNMIGDRLKKWKPAELKQAIDGVANSKWHTENGQNGFDLIFKNDRQVEKYISMCRETKNDQEEIPWIHQN